MRRLLARNYFWQIILWLLLAIGIYVLVKHVAEQLTLRGVPSGFDFLMQPAGFEISDTWLAFEAGQSYLAAFLVGMVNTLQVASVAIVVSTLIGCVVGVARAANHPLLRMIAAVYVECVRNVPLLLQLLLLYWLFLHSFPSSDETWRLSYLALDQTGLALQYWDESLQLHVHVIVLTPEFISLTVGLSIYTSAFIAEIVRAGIASVATGIKEAAQALSLSAWHQYLDVIFPLAMRLALPPMTSQYLNIFKNSSLAVAIGYPELLSIGQTSINQTGRALECLSIVMLIYLTISLVTAWGMQRYQSSMVLRYDT